MMPTRENSRDILSIAVYVVGSEADVPFIEGVYARSRINTKKELVVGLPFDQIQLPCVAQNNNTQNQQNNNNETYKSTNQKQIKEIM